ncbi:MAG: hypothetical protein H7288_05755 [Kineosporiaceae bacterium]|nr:hypothetical protein [Aeromicrobium sp.]
MRCVATVIAAILMTLLTPVASYAGGGCPAGTTPAPGVGGICIPVVDPGTGGGNTPIGSGGGGTPGEDVCQWTLASPQPPASDPAWGGNSSDDGKLFLCVLPGTGTPTYRFVPDGEATPPDPAVLAARALGQLRLTVPDVHTAPASPSKTYVGLETWLWMPSEQWTTLTKSVTAGATTVTVTAKPQKVEWKMGAGSTSCHDAGRPWQTGKMSKTDRTSCKFVYTRVSDFQPDKKFTMSAVITFDVAWVCSGDCLADDGVMGAVDGLPGNSSISVGERQSVNISPKEL